MNIEIYYGWFQANITCRVIFHYIPSDLWKPIHSVSIQNTTYWTKEDSFTSAKYLYFSKKKQKLLQLRHLNNILELFCCMSKNRLEFSSSSAQNQWIDWAVEVPKKSLWTTKRLTEKGKTKEFKSCKEISL